MIRCLGKWSMTSPHLIPNRYSARIYLSSAIKKKMNAKSAIRNPSIIKLSKQNQSILLMEMYSTKFNSKSNSNNNCNNKRKQSLKLVIKMWIERIV
jgi:hypothetical protein